MFYFLQFFGETLNYSSFPSGHTTYELQHGSIFNSIHNFANLD